MPTRRNFLETGATVLYLGALGGCGTPVQAPAQAPRAPRFQWGQPVEFESIRFQFNSARIASSFTNWVNQRTQAAETFVIVDVTITNRTGAPLPIHFQPIFRLLDGTGAIYEPDLQNSIMINMQKPGRATYGENMNPNTNFKQEIVFSVPKRSYVVQVIVPSRARVGFGGAVTSSGLYFLYEISSQLGT